MSEDSPPNGADRLNGWKEIAAHLGKSVRSVQRWERHLKLPVRRIKTTDGQIVGASKREIDAWRAQLERSGHALESDGDELDVAASSEPSEAPQIAGAFIPPPPAVPRAWHFSGWAVGIVAGVTVLVIAFFLPSLLSGARPARPAAYVLIGTNLEFRDRDDRTIGTYPFGRDVSGMFGSRLVNGRRDDELTEVDLDGDGSVEHLVPVHSGRSDESSRSSDGLYVFADDHRMLWNAVPALTFSCNSKTLEGPWRLEAVQLSSGPAPKRIWMAFTHHKEAISFVLEVKAGGQQSLRYLQYGWIMSLAEWMTPAGPRLVAGGVLHTANRASVVILNPDSPPAYSPNTDPRITCENPPTGIPERVVLLPTSDVTIAQGTPYPMIDNFKLAGPNLEAESDDVVFTFGPDGIVKEVQVGDVYWGRHRNLESEGKLHHSAAACPELSKPHEIITWTNGGPRQTYLIQPANILPSGRR